MCSGRDPSNGSRIPLHHKPHFSCSMSFGLPLTPPSDACRTARHALTLIATARPGAFITTMAREVARYNTLQQNAQAIQINLNNIILNRSKPEILRIIELLIEKMQSEIGDLIVEVSPLSSLSTRLSSIRLN